MKSPLAWLFPSLKNLWFILLLAGALARGNTLLNADGDLGHHLALGRLILESRQIPATDPFSFRTEGVPAIPHEWLTEVIFAGLEKAFGLGGIVFFSALLIAAALTVTFTASLRRSRLWIAALLISGLTLATSATHWITRPHLVTFLLLAVWTEQVETFAREEQRRWWIFPLLMLAWANLHGMFVLGLFSLGLAAAGNWFEFPSLRGQTLRRFAPPLLTSALATLFTPSGLGLWAAILRLAGSSTITGLTSEYAVADFHNPGFWPFLLFLGLALGAGLLNRGVFPVRDGLALAGWTLLGLYSARNLPLATLALAPLVSDILAGWMNAQNGFIRLIAFSRRLEAAERPLRGWLWAGLAALALFWLTARGISLDPQGRAYQFEPDKFPVDAVTWLENHPPAGRMVNEFDWGGYLLLRLWPEQQIFMDGHTHIYGEERTLEYLQVIQAQPGWENSFNRWEINWAILKPDTPLAAALTASGWQVLYRDSTAVVLERP